MADLNDPVNLPQYVILKDALEASEKFVASRHSSEDKPKITLMDYFNVGIAFVFQEGENDEKRTANAYLIRRANQELLRTFWRLRDNPSTLRHAELFKKPTRPDSDRSGEFEESEVDRDNGAEESDAADDGGAEEQDKRRRERASTQKSADETYHSAKGDSDTEEAQAEDADKSQRNREDTPKAAGEGGRLTPPDTSKPDSKSKTPGSSRSRAKGRPMSQDEDSEDDVKQPKSRRGKRNSKSQRKKQRKGDDSMPPPPPPEPLQTPLQSIKNSVRGSKWLPDDLSLSLANGLALVGEQVPQPLRLSVMSGRGDVYELINKVCREMDNGREWDLIQMGNGQPASDRAKALALLTLGTIFGIDGVYNLKELVTHTRLEATVQAVIGGYANDDAGQKAWAAEDNIDFDQEFDQKAMLQLKTELGSDEDPLQVPIRIAADYLRITSRTAYPSYIQEALYSEELSRSIDAVAKKITDHDLFRVYCFKLVGKSPGRGYSDRNLALSAVTAHLIKGSSEQQLALTTEAVPSNAIILGNQNSLGYGNYDAKIKKIIHDMAFNGERLNQLVDIFGEGCLPLWLSSDWITRTRDKSMPILEAIWANMKKQCPELRVGLVTLEKNVLLPMFTFHDPRGPVSMAVESKDKDTWTNSTWLQLIQATDDRESRGPGSKHKALIFAPPPGATSIDPAILAAVNSTPISFVREGSDITVDKSGTPLVFRAHEKSAASVNDTPSTTAPNPTQTEDEEMLDSNDGAYEED